MLAAPCLPARAAVAPKRVVSHASRGVRCAATPIQKRKATIRATVSAGSVLASAGAANATELSRPLQQFVDAVDTAAAVVSEGSKKSGELIEGGKALYSSASPYVDRAGKALAPVADTVSKVAGRTLEPIKVEVIKAGTGAATTAVSGLDSFVSSQGVDTSTIKSGVGTLTQQAPTVAKGIQPVLESLLNLIVKSDPATLAETGIVLYVLYLVLPLGLSAVSTSFRGYAGNVSPPQALNMLMKDKKVVMMDVRTPEEKNAKGIVDLPKGNRDQLKTLVRTTLERGPFKNNTATENKITAVQVAALKATANKGKDILILDQNDKQAKNIAKELTSLGYSNVYVVDGGFVAWVGASLQTKSLFSTKADAVFMSRPIRALPSVQGRPVSRVVDVEVMGTQGNFLKLPPGK